MINSPITHEITDTPLESQIWTSSADHHTGQRFFENAAFKGLTEDRT